MVQDLNATFSRVRTVVFSVVSLFAFLELALGAAITNWTSTNFLGSYFTFAAVGIATAVLTLLSLPVMLFLSLKRKGAITSMILIEFAWTWFLWIMWVSTGGSTASVFMLTDCSGRFIDNFESLCREVQAFQAFGFLTWIILFGYNMFLLVLAIRQQMRGNSSIWRSYILETDFSAAGSSAPGFTEQKFDPSSFAPQYPPAQGGTPVGYAGQPAAVNPHPQMMMASQPASTSPYAQV